MQFGFDVTQSVTISDSTVVELDPGEGVRVIAVPNCRLYVFDVYKWMLFGGNQKKGPGQAYYVVGFCVTVYEL